ncbi:MAG: hypothetical protein V4592_19385 [Bacteroidota bacterium]
MKKFIIILGIILTSGIAALALSANKTAEIKTAQIKSDRNEMADVAKGQEYGAVKSNLTNAD